MNGSKYLYSQPKVQDESRFSFALFFKAVIKRWWILLIGVLLGAGGSSIYAFGIKKDVYQADGQLYITGWMPVNGEEKVSLRLAFDLVPILMDFMCSDDVLVETTNRINEEFSYSLSKGSIGNALSVEPNGDPEEYENFYVDTHCRTTNQDFSASLVSTWMQATIDLAKDPTRSGSEVFGTKLSISIQPTYSYEEKEKIHYTHMNEVSTPNYQIILWGILIGFLLAFGVIMIIEYGYNKVVSYKEIEEMTGEQFIGCIPDYLLSPKKFKEIDRFR